MAVWGIPPAAAPVEPCGDDPRGAQMLGDLDGELAGDSGRSENEDGLSWLQSCAPDERKPRRERRIRECRRGDVIDTCRNRQAPASGDDGLFRHHPEPGPRPAAEDPSPIVEDADPVDTAHDG
jgi:hypothetical protein